MTVFGLIEILRKYPPDSLVIVAKDEEGNAYNELSCVQKGSYNSRTSEFNGHPSDIKEFGLKINSVCLWP